MAMGYDHRTNGWVISRVKAPRPLFSFEFTVSWTRISIIRSLQFLIYVRQNIPIPMLSNAHGPTPL